MTDLPTYPIRFADLSARKASNFTLEPDAEARAALATGLGIPALKRLRFAGQLTPRGRRDWHLSADLGATAQQECVVTLAPVTTRIDETVTRHFIADWHEPEAAEVEMTEDTTSEPLPATLDLYAVALEALSLALPAWPRAEGAELAPARAAPEGVKPLEDADLRPFAGLAGLRDKLATDEPTDGDDGDSIE